MIGSSNHCSLSGRAAVLNFFKRDLPAIFLGGRRQFLFSGLGIEMDSDCHEIWHDGQCTHNLGHELGSCDMDY